DHEDDQRDLEGERQESGEHADEPDHGLEHHQADDGEDAAGRDLRYQPHGSLRANGWALRSDPPTAAGAGKIHEPAAAARREPSTPGSKQIRGRSRPEYATCVLPPLPRGNDSTPGRTDSRTGLARVAPVVHGPRRLGGNAWRRVDTTSNPGDDPMIRSLRTLALAAVLVGAVVAPRPLAAQAAEAGPARKQAARRAAEAWLALMDQGKYAESWQAAGSLFRQAVTAEQWAQQVAAVVAQVGAFQRRELQKTEFTTELP